MKSSKYLPIKSLGPKHFIINGIIIHLLAYIKSKIISSIQRTPQYVEKIYDNERSQIKINNLNFNETNFGKSYKKEKDFILLNNKVVYDFDIKARVKIIFEIKKELFKLKDSSNIFEIGCGSGTNIIYCAKKFPNLNFYGCDISGETIKLCNKIKKKFNIKNLFFFKQDITKEIIDKNLRFDLVYTCFALEQIPEHTLKAVRNIFKLNSKKILFIEPDTSFLKFDVIGIISILRSNHLNRLKNLKKDIKKILNEFRNYRIKEANLTNYAHNPFCRATKILIQNFS